MTFPQCSQLLMIIFKWHSNPVFHPSRSSLSSYFLLFLLFLLPGTQSIVDRHSSPEHCGGTLQSASFSGASSVPFRDRVPQRLWRPQNRGTGVKYAHVDKYLLTNRCTLSLPAAHFIDTIQLSDLLVFGSAGSEAAGHPKTHDVTKAQRGC